jgi:YD repeat-containing protein
MPKPIVVYRPPVVYTTPVVNPIVTVASNPAPPADIRLTNPAGNRVTLTYTLNGQMVRRLPAGASVQINQEAVIEFDRGGGMGTARYGLTDGAYKFVAAGGAWNLVRDIPTTAADAPVAAVAANPAPGN